MALALAACSDGAQSRADLVHLKNPNASTESKVTIEWPRELRSAPNNIIDLSKPEEVAKAMGIQLDGKPDQILYEISITGSSQSMGDNGFARWSFPVTVANVKDTAALIGNLTGGLAAKQPQQQGR